MTELLRFRTEDGGSLLVEVDEHEPGFRPASRAAAIADAKQKFEDALVDVRAAAERALAVFTEGTLRPDQVDVEFGVRLNAEAGAVIAKTSVEGHMTVKLSWKPTGRAQDSSAEVTPAAR